MMKRLVFVLCVAVLCVCLFLPSPCEAKRKRKRPKGRSESLALDKQKIGSRDGITSEDQRNDWTPRLSLRERQQSQVQTTRHSLCQAEDCKEDASGSEGQDGARKEKRNRNRRKRRRKKPRSSPEIRKNNKKRTKNGDSTKKNDKKVPRRRPDIDYSDDNGSSTKRQPSEPDIVVESAENTESESPSEQEDLSKERTGSARKDETRRRNKKWDPSALKKARMDLRRRQKGSKNRSPKIVDTTPKIVNTTPKTVQEVRIKSKDKQKYKNVSFHFEFPPFERPVADMPESDRKILKYLALQTARLDLRRRFGPNSKYRMESVVKKKKKPTGSVADTRQESKNATSQQHDMGTVADVPFKSTKRLKLADLWKAREDLRRRHGFSSKDRRRNKNKKQQEHKQSSSFPTERPAADMPSETTNRLQKLADLNKARQGLRQRQDSQVEDDSRDVDLVKDQKDDKSKRKKSKKSKAELKSKSNRKGKSKKDRKNRKLLKSHTGKNRNGRRRNKGRGRERKRNKGKSNKDLEVDIYKQPLSDMPAPKTDEKLQKLASLRRARLDLRKRLGSSEEDENSETKLSISKKSKRKRKHRKRKGRKGKGRKGKGKKGKGRRGKSNLTGQTLKEAERKFERKNVKIERRLDVLKQNTLDDLSVLKSVIFDHHGDLFPNNSLSIMNLDDKFDSETDLGLELESPEEDQPSEEVQPPVVRVGVTKISGNSGESADDVKTTDGSPANWKSSSSSTDEDPHAMPQSDEFSGNLMEVKSATEWYKVFHPFSDRVSVLDFANKKVSENQKDKEESDKRAAKIKRMKKKRQRQKQRRRQRKLEKKRKQQKQTRSKREKKERAQADGTGDINQKVSEVQARSGKRKMSDGKVGKTNGSKPSGKFRMSKLKRNSRHQKVLQKWKLQRQKIDEYKKRLKQKSRKNRKLRQKISAHQRKRVSGHKRKSPSKHKKRKSDRQQRRMSARKRKLVTAQKKKRISTSEWKGLSVEQKKPTPQRERVSTREKEHTTTEQSKTLSSPITTDVPADWKSRVSTLNEDYLPAPEQKNIMPTLSASGQKSSTSTQRKNPLSAERLSVEQSDQTGSRRLSGYHPEPGRRRGYYAPREDLRLREWSSGRWRPDPNSKNSMMAAAAPYDSKQRVSPVLNRSYRQLMLRMNGILQGIYGQMQMTESLYKEVFNGTRYDLILGARDIFENVAFANTYIYDGVVKASELTRSIYTKAHHNRKARRMNRVQDQPQIPTDIQVNRRNFKPILEKAYREQNMIREDLQKTQRMKMRSMQDRSRFQQVREKLTNDYDSVAVRDLFYNINSTIYQVNGGIVTSPRLSRLQRDKYYITFVDSDVKEASVILRNSTEEVSKGLMEYRENYDLYLSWRKNGNGQNVQRDAGSYYSRREWARLETLVSKAKRHAYNLESESYDLNSWLGDAIENANMALEVLGRPVGPSSSSSVSGPYVTNLEEETKQLHAVLEDLRKMVGSPTKAGGAKESINSKDKDASSKEKTVEIKKEKKCKPSGGFGGWLGGGDTDCVSEGSGDDELETGSGDDIILITDDEDFIFEEGSSETGTPTSTNMFGIALREYASKVLSDSRVIDKEADEVEGLLKDLQKKREKALSEATLIYEILGEQQGLILQEADVHALREDVKYRTKEVFKNVQAISTDFDLDAIVAQARRALERAKKESEVDGSKQPPPPEPTPTGQDSEENTEEDVEVVDAKEDDFDYSSLYRKGREIMSNSNDIRYLRSVAVESCGKFKSQFGFIRSNISILQQKVASARKILSSLQLSIKKSGSNYIAVEVNDTVHHKTEATSVTTFGMCIKPSTLDGTVLVVKGNGSASYSVSLDSGELTVSAYDSYVSKLDDITLDLKLKIDQWYTIWVQRSGQMMNVTLQEQAGEAEMKSVFSSDLPSTQPMPQLVFVGGAPESSYFDSSSWEGCMGRLTVNGQSLSLFRPDSEGVPTALCTDHCVSAQGPSSVFDGNGFIHHRRPVRETVNKIAFRFKTRQEKAVLFSYANRNKRLSVSVIMEGGALKVESSGPVEEVVLLSLNSSLNDGQSHLLEIVYRGSRTYPELDGNSAAFSVERVSPQVLRNIMEGVLIGAFVSDRRQFLNLPFRPLIGCVGEVFINENKLRLPDATEVYNAYEGTCTSSSPWHSCWKFTERSSPVSLGSVENSNRVSFLVDANARGPVLLYTKDEKFELEIRLTDDGIDTSMEGEESVLIKPSDYSKDFTLVTIEDTGDKVITQAWDETTSFSYGSAWSLYKDTETPHDIALSQTRDGEERKFVGGIAHLMIGDRLYDLGQLRSTNTLMTCERPLEQIHPAASFHTLPPVDEFSCS